MATKKDLFEMDRLAGELGEVGRDLWLAGLGVIITVEEEGVRLMDAFAERRKAWAAEGRKQLEDLQQEATRVFDDLVARGKTVEARGRKQLDDRIDSVKGEVEAVKQDVVDRRNAVVEQVEHAVAKTMEGMMERLEVPTRTEVQALGRKVDQLAKKVKALTTLLEQQQAEQPQA